MPQVRGRPRQPVLPRSGRRLTSRILAVCRSRHHWLSGGRAGRARAGMGGTRGTRAHAEPDDRARRYEEIGADLDARRQLIEEAETDLKAREQRLALAEEELRDAQAEVAHATAEAERLRERARELD